MPTRDSGLEQSIGPLTPGHDLPPVDVTSSGNLELPPLLPVFSVDTNHPLPEIEPPPGANGHATAEKRDAGEIWLDGDVIMCACPDCGAPMSVRIWLMMAECWRCDTVIELNEEQEREAMKLLAEREAKQKKAAAVPSPSGRGQGEGQPPKASPAPAAKPAVPPPPPPPAPVAERRPTAPVNEARPAPRTPPPVPLADRPTPPPATAPTAVPPAPPPQPAAPQRQRRQPARARARVNQPFTVDRLLKMTPAWIISMLIHLLALMLLAILTTSLEEEGEPLIVLNASVAQTAVRAEGETNPVVKMELAKFDMPVDKKELENPKTRDVLLKANQDALELRLDSEEVSLPDIDVVKAHLSNPSGASYSVAARDPRIRAELVTHEGGTTLTEAAVARGLRWLSMHQDEDGTWSLSNFSRAANCNCGGHGAIGHKSPGTALAMLPFLGAGQTHLVGRYKGNVSKALRWMLENQGKDGDLRAGATDNSGMYTHGQATIVLCEAFAMTGDEKLRQPAQRAVDFICKSQYEDGGWRYQPTPRNQPGDTSVVGWQLMALQSARSANLTVPEDTLKLAMHYLDTVKSRDGIRYCYIRNHNPSHVMTAEALLCRMYLGWQRDEIGLMQGAEYLVGDHLPHANEPNIYYWYYGTQTMHHIGGRDWETWNTRMRDILVNSQQTDGHRAGSWEPRGEHANVGGRIYMTSLAVCSLEVYYRHLPIFRQIELDRK